MSRISFIWGPGGVGKSHAAIKEAVERKSSSTLLMTLDPSGRVLELLEQDRTALEAQVKVGPDAFVVKTTSPKRLFESLSNRKTPDPKVQWIYDQMSKGLQDFRDYLTLIQLSDELKNQDFEHIIIDTPPFQEAIHLQKSLFLLKSFFSKSLVQWAVKSQKFSLFHAPLKKVFEVVRIFSGKRAADQIFGFIDWLTEHLDRFKESANYLEELAGGKNTEHVFVLTPETSALFLQTIKASFPKNTKMRFIVNRSTLCYRIPQSDEPFVKEIFTLQAKEQSLDEHLQEEFPKAKVNKIPMILMGEDTPEELIRFVNLKA